VVDAQARTARIACAGHPLPLLSRQGEPVVPLHCESPTPLLLRELTAVPCAKQELRAGDRVLFYTDGVTDRETLSGDRYDVPRLGAALVAGRAKSVDQAMSDLVNEIESFAEGDEPQD